MAASMGYTTLQSDNNSVTHT